MRGLRLSSSFLAISTSRVFQKLKAPYTNPGSKESYALEGDSEGGGKFILSLFELTLAEGLASASAKMKIQLV